MTVGKKTKAAEEFGQDETAEAPGFDEAEASSDVITENGRRPSAVVTELANWGA